MSRLPLAVTLLVLAAVARADTLGDLKSKAGSAAVEASGKSEAVSTSRIRYSGCDDKQQQRMDAAIEGAMKMVDSCLSTYNKGVMARDIKRDFKRFEFSCSQEVRASGGVTVRSPLHGKLKSADISMTMHSALQQYALEARVFHEMIHAVDGDARHPYIVSREMHNILASPDPVYGCQFACYGGVYDDERKAVARYEKRFGVEIPTSERKVECSDGQDCATLSQYVYLCETAKPITNKEVNDTAHKAGAPKCIAEHLLNACDGIDNVNDCGGKGMPKGELCKTRCEILEAERDNGGRYPDYIVTKMLGIGADLERAHEGNKAALTTDQEKRLYADEATEGIITECNK